MGNHICNFDKIIVERDEMHPEVEIAVVDECGILRRFAIEFRGFRKFGFLVCRRTGRGMGRRWSGFLQLPDNVSERSNLLLQFSVANH